MFRTTSIAVVLTLTCIASLCNAEDKKADPTGTWKWTVTMGDNKRDVTLKLELKDDKLTGTMPGRDNTEIKIDDGKFKDGEISFSVTRERNGNKRTSKYSGKLEGDTIKGKIEFEREGKTESRDWEAKREAK